jgi:hypothetical protein
MKKVLVVCSPSARKAYEKNVRAYCKTNNIDKQAVVYLTTDQSITGISTRIREHAEDIEVIFIGVPNGTCNKIYHDCIPMKVLPKFLFINTNLVPRKNAEPLDERIIMYDSIERFEKQKLAA